MKRNPILIRTEKRDAEKVLLPTLWTWVIRFSARFTKLSRKLNWRFQNFWKFNLNSTFCCCQRAGINSKRCRNKLIIINYTLAHLYTFCKFSQRNETAKTSPSSKRNYKYTFLCGFFHLFGTAKNEHKLKVTRKFRGCRMHFMHTSWRDTFNTKSLQKNRSIFQWVFFLSSFIYILAFICFALCFFAGLPLPMSHSIPMCMDFLGNQHEITLQNTKLHSIEHFATLSHAHIHRYTWRPPND